MQFLVFVNDGVKLSEDGSIYLEQDCHYVVLGSRSRDEAVATLESMVTTNVIHAYYLVDHVFTEVDLRGCIECDGGIESGVDDNLAQFYGVYIRDAASGLWRHLIDMTSKYEATVVARWLSQAVVS